MVDALVICSFCPKLLDLLVPYSYRFARLFASVWSRELGWFIDWAVFTMYCGIWASIRVWRPIEEYGPACEVILVGVNTVSSKYSWLRFMVD